MGALDTIGEIAGGLQQGVAGLSQGMSLYSQYDQMQTQAREGQSKREIENQISEMSQAGELSDPIEAPKAIARMYMDHGLSDIAAQYQQHADAALKAAGDKRLMSAASMAKLDAFGAVAQLNEHSKLMQTGEQFVAVRTPTGVQISYKGPGGETVKEYASGDQFHADVLEYAMPYLDPGGLAGAEKTRSEVEENKAQTEAVRASALQEAALLPARQALLGAQASSASASAADSAASAANRRVMQPYEIKKTEAEIGALNARDEGSIGKAMKEAGIGANTNSLDPTPIERDPVAIHPLATSITQNMGVAPNEGVALAVRLAGMNKLEIDPEAGVARDKFGTIYNVGPQAAQALDDIMAQREAARKAAKEAE